MLRPFGLLDKVMDLLCPDITHIGKEVVLGFVYSRASHYVLMPANFEHRSKYKQFLVVVLSGVSSENEVRFFVGEIPLKNFLPT